MKTIFASAALFVASALAQNSFMINTPSNVVECQPLQLNWQGGTKPYFLSVLPGASPNGAAIESFPETNSTSYTWLVNIASGTSIGFTLRDSTGATAQSAAVTVNPGSSTSCLNSTSASPGPTGSESSSSSAPATVTSNSASGTTAGAATGTSSSATSTSTAKSGASANVAQFGAAGIIGAAVAALFL